MSDLGWSVALFWSALGFGLTLIVIGTAKRAKRRNRRIHLPAPACNRVPAWNDNLHVETPREIR